MDLSILIPSNKEPHYLNHTIKTYLSADNPKNYEFEILISTPDPSKYSFDDPRIKVYEDIKLQNYQDVRLFYYPNKVDRNQAENYIPNVGLLYNNLYYKSSGKFIFFTADDFGVEPNFVTAVIEHGLSDEIQSRRFKLFALEHRGHPHWPMKPFNWPILGTPVIDRDTIENELNGKIMRESFYHHYVDTWLTYYVAKLERPGTIFTGTGMISPGGATPKTPMYDGLDEEKWQSLMDDMERGINVPYA